MDRYYLSFCGPRGWIGGMFVQASNRASAFYTAVLHGAPDGSCVCLRVPDDKAPYATHWFNRLLNMEEIGRASESEMTNIGVPEMVH